ncbi:hypothetical protein GCM10022262_41080 [Georgenia daeguensis]|uniref:Glutaredoxin domain-containing protein n=1 Tax=Georgenia daeguensis TaxID=908355 RepID=A0ABP6UME9_9MICO
MLIIYGTRGCAACRLTENVLRRASAPFEVVDLEQFPAKAIELRTAGYEALPVVQHAGQSWSGFQPDRLREAIAFGSAARIGDRLGHAAWVAGVVMMVSYSMGVNRPRASCRRRRW